MRWYDGSLSRMLSLSNLLHILPHSFLVARFVATEAWAQLGRAIMRRWQLRHTESKDPASAPQNEHTISLRIHRPNKMQLNWFGV